MFFHVAHNKCSKHVHFTTCDLHPDIQFFLSIYSEYGCNNQHGCFMFS